MSSPRNGSILAGYAGRDERHIPPVGTHDLLRQPSYIVYSSTCGCHQVQTYFFQRLSLRCGAIARVIGIPLAARECDVSSPAIAAAGGAPDEEDFGIAFLYPPLGEEVRYAAIMALGGGRWNCGGANA